MTEIAKMTEVLPLPTISCELNLSDIYARIDFSEETFESK